MARRAATKAGLTGLWCGRRAAAMALAMIRCLCRMAIARPSAKWSPRRSMGFRIGRELSRNWSMTSSENDLAIYVHWPFCKAKCPYCDFNSHVRHQGVDTKRFTEALIAELAWFAEASPGRRVTSIFFG